MKEFNHHLSDICDIIHKHCICKLLLIFTIAAFIRKVVSFEPFYSSLLTILSSDKFGDENLIKLSKVLLDSLICVNFVISLEFFDIFRPDLTRNSLTRMYIPVDLHEDLVRIGYLRFLEHFRSSLRYVLRHICVLESEVF